MDDHYTDQWTTISIHNLLAIFLPLHSSLHIYPYTHTPIHPYTHTNNHTIYCLFTYSNTTDYTTILIHSPCTTLYYTTLQSPTHPPTANPKQHTYTTYIMHKTQLLHPHFNRTHYRPQNRVPTRTTHLFQAIHSVQLVQYTTIYCCFNPITNNLPYSLY